MAVLNVKNISGETISEVEVSDDIFCVPIKPEVLHQVVTMQLANKRSGSAKVKHRSDVKGSTKKLFRQKGTGRARRGDIKSPLLRGGGVVFGPDGRSYTQNVPKKVKKLALKMALSTKFKKSRLIVLDNLELDQIKTQAFVTILDTLNISNALIVIDEENEKLDFSSRNVPYVKVLRKEGLNVYDILKYKNLILLESSIEGIERRILS
jgi:large subunit ribosomal protein L4